MAFFVMLRVIFALDDTPWIRRYDWFCANLRNVGKRSIGIISSIRKYSLRIHAFKQCLRLGIVSGLSGSEDITQRIAERIDDDVDFSGESAFRAA